MKKLFFLLFLLCGNISAQTTEFRGVWALMTFKNTTATEQYSALFSKFHEYNFNNVMFYTVLMGMANYPTDLVPWNQYLTGHMGKDPGWDPLATAVQLAHAKGLLLHAKMNLFYAWEVNKPLPTYSGNPINTHPDWIHYGRDGKPMINQGEHLFFNPCHPGVQDWIYNYSMEIVKKYGVDGLHFDYVRYPNKGFSWDSVTQNRFWARYGKSPDALPLEWDDWRREQITNLLLHIKTSASRIKPNLIIGADVYSDRVSAKNYELQDYERWSEMGITDFLSPMLYTTDTISFLSLLKDQINHSNNRSIVAGIGVYAMGENTTVLANEINLSRSQNASGVMLFKDESLFPNFTPNATADFMTTRFFSTPAASPNYPWKTKTESVPPVFKGLNAAEPRAGMAVLRWKPGIDSTLPITYTIYQSTTKGVFDFSLPSYVTQDTVLLVENLNMNHPYYFIVRAQDRFGNEDNNIQEKMIVSQRNLEFILENFNSGTSLYWKGNSSSGIIFNSILHSPYTQGVSSSSRLEIVPGDINRGSSEELQIVWTDTTTGQCFLTTEPMSPLFPDFTGWSSIWIYGYNDNTKISPVFGDSGTEKAPSITINWNGWKRMEWFLPTTVFTGWNGGDGKLSGGAFGGKFYGLLIQPGSEGLSHFNIGKISNTLRPDENPPQFSGLKSVQQNGKVSHLSWNMALDANNPVTYKIYLSTSSTLFDFSRSYASTQLLEYDVTLPSSDTDYFFIVRAYDTEGNENSNRTVKVTKIQP